MYGHDYEPYNELKMKLVQLLENLPIIIYLMLLHASYAQNYVAQA